MKLTETPISNNVEKMECWINSGNTISDYFLKKRLGFDDDMIQYYSDQRMTGGNTASCWSFGDDLSYFLTAWARSSADYASVM